MGDTRARIIEEAMRLFGEQGYARTTIAQVERAAGLSAGSGALYRHFRSKEELLVEAVRATVGDRAEWAQYLADDFSVIALLEALAPDVSLVERLVLLCRIGLGRLDHDRDVTRVLLRDNSAPSAALEAFRRDELQVVNAVVAKGLTELAGPVAYEDDWDATAAVLTGAIANYWMLTDTFDGEYPLDMDIDRYLRAAARIIAARLEQSRPDKGSK